MMILVGSPAAFAGDIKPPAPAPVKAGPGVNAVKKATQTIGDLLKKKVEPNSKEEKDLSAKVMTSVRDFLDIEQLGKRAMVDNWTKLSTTQQAQFQTLLRDLIEENYVKGLRTNLTYEIEYVSESADQSGNIVVATKIKTQRKGRPYTILVDYILQKEGERLRAFDVRTDGVSLIDNYRSMFNKIMAKDGFDGLMSKMKNKQSAQR